MRQNVCNVKCDRGVNRRGGDAEENLQDINSAKFTGHKQCQRNWVFVTNSDFLIPISLQPNVVDLRYFKLWILLDQII